MHSIEGQTNSCVATKLDDVAALDRDPASLGVDDDGSLRSRRLCRVAEHVAWVTLAVAARLAAEKVSAAATGTIISWRFLFSDMGSRRDPKKLTGHAPM